MLFKSTLTFVALISIASVELPVQQKQIPVLSVGTFHMTCTSDKYTTPYNAKDPKRVKEISELVDKLAAFKPTIIALEHPFEDQKTLDEEFQNFLQNKRTSQSCDGERELIGFELAKRLRLAKVFGIDARLNYDYEKIMALARETGNKTYQEFQNSQLTVFKSTDKKFVDTHTTLDLIKLTNQKDVLNEVYLLNAGIFTYVNTPNSYEGADVAADFYKRNLRIFANLNKIEKKETDRILILCGAGHTVFINDLIERSPIYELYDLESVLD